MKTATQKKELENVRKAIAVKKRLIEIIKVGKNVKLQLEIAEELIMLRKAEREIMRGLNYA